MNLYIAIALWRTIEDIKNVERTFSSMHHIFFFFSRSINSQHNPQYYNGKNLQLFWFSIDFHHSEKNIYIYTQIKYYIPHSVFLPILFRIWIFETYIFFHFYLKGCLCSKRSEIYAYIFYITSTNSEDSSSYSIAQRTSLAFQNNAITYVSSHTIKILGSTCPKLSAPDFT